MNASKSTLFRFLFVAPALLASGNLRAGTFTLDPPSPSWPNSSNLLSDEPGPLGALPRLGVPSTSLGLGAGDWINAISDGRDPMNEGQIAGTLHLIFSVRRSSRGLPGTDVRQEKVNDTAPPAGNNPRGQASDLFTWDGTIGANDLATSALGWASGFGGDEAATNLRIPNQNHRGDNVDGYERSTMRFFNPGHGDDGWNGNPGKWNDWVEPWPNDGPVDPDDPEIPDNPDPGIGGVGGASPTIFFSLRSGSATLAALGYSAADILAVGGSFGAAPVVFVSHAALGLQFEDDLDALSMEVRRNTFGNLYAKRVRFSVRSGTTPFSGADILDYDGVSTTILHTANDLGLRDHDDVDALESVVVANLFGDFDDDDIPVVPVEPVVPFVPEVGVVQPKQPKSRTISARPVFRRGDADGNGRVQLADAIATLNALFVGDVDLPCEDAADSDDDGRVTLADAVVTLDTLFAGNVVIPVPGLRDCGADPTKDALGCEVYDTCD